MPYIPEIEIKKRACAENAVNKLKAINCSYGELVERFTELPPYLKNVFYGLFLMFGEAVDELEAVLSHKPDEEEAKEGAQP